MYEHKAAYQIAVTSAGDDGLQAGLQWCLDDLHDGDRVTVWTRLKINLRDNPLLREFVASHRHIDHVTARGGAFLRHAGPVLMAWPDPGDISEFTSRNAKNITALCVVSWDEARLRPWVSAAQPELLGDTSAWQELTPALDPVVEEGMKLVTMTINHNNTIGTGYEKDDVVATLLALHDAGYVLDGPTLAGWAVAHGWTSDNPVILERYVAAINKGTRPRHRRALDPNLIHQLRARTNAATSN